MTAMMIEEVVDESALAAHIESGMVNCQAHPNLPLRILNYSQKAQFSGTWDDVTCVTRGLIVDENGGIVARPFRKFFNLGHNGRPETDLTALPTSTPEITEKMDGSLGIFWKFHDKAGVATRGSFSSDQAKWATEWYQKNLANAIWPAGYTPLFEIIYPDNRIVVDYEWEGLVLLALVEIETGKELPHEEVSTWAKFNHCRCVELFEMTVDEARLCGRTNFEGFVLTWHDPYIKVKVKLEEYCRLHRIMTGFSPIALWEHLRFGWPIDDIKTAVKDSEFLQWINLHEQLFREGVARINGEFDRRWDGRPTDLPNDPREARKQLAAYIHQPTNKAFSSMFFAKLDGKDYQDDIWKALRPNGAHPFKRDLG